jgi:hypothetical protein
MTPAAPRHGDITHGRRFRAGIGSVAAFVAVAARTGLIALVGTSLLVVESVGPAPPEVAIAGSRPLWTMSERLGHWLRTAKSCW